MTVIKVRPHEELCPDGTVLEAKPGQTVAEVLIENDVKIEHACELSCACTTCHVIVRRGFNSLEAESRLSCQAVVKSDELEIELPKYTINMVSEEH